MAQTFATDRKLLPPRPPRGITFTSSPGLDNREVVSGPRRGWGIRKRAIPFGYRIGIVQNRQDCECPAERDPRPVSHGGSSGR